MDKRYIIEESNYFYDVPENYTVDIYEWWVKSYSKLIDRDSGEVVVECFSGDYNSYRDRLFSFHHKCLEHLTNEEFWHKTQRKRIDNITFLD